MILRNLIAVAFLVSVTACTSAGGGSSTSGPEQLYLTALAAPDRTQPISPDQGYRLGPLDKIDVVVFGQKDLSVEKIQVDAGGQVVLPLVGAITAGGRTAQELSLEIEGRLGERYLQSPHVSVMINESVSQRITVFGAVEEAGVYPLKGPTTLVQAVALAKGPDMKVANLRNTAIFRTTGGKRAAAMFDLAAIRDGQAVDPEVYGGDIIIVQNSRQKSLWRDFVELLPGLGVFRYY